MRSYTDILTHYHCFTIHPTYKTTHTHTHSNIHRQTHIAKIELNFMFKFLCKCVEMRKCYIQVKYNTNGHTQDHKYKTKQSFM